MRKIVFFDIDGTLVDSFAGVKEMREDVKKSIKDLQAQGNYIFIATGRPYAFLSQEILNFGFDGFILANGALATMNGKILYSDFMDKDYVKNMVNEFDRCNIQYTLETPHYTYLKKEFKEFNYFYNKVGINNELIIQEYDLSQLQVQKIEVLCPDEYAAKKCVSLVESNSEYGYFSSVSEKAYEIYLKRNTKAHGILKVLDILNIPIEDSYAFGDGINDIEMLSTVGCGIAMGNASDEVKKYAHKVTESVHDDGVAVGIKEYIYC